GNECRQWNQWQGPWLMNHHRSHDAVHVRGYLRVAAMLAGDYALPSVQASQELFRGFCVRYFREGFTGPFDRVRITSPNTNVFQPASEFTCSRVRARPHLSVANLKRWTQREQLEVVLAALAGQPGKHMVHAIKELTLCQIHLKRHKIVSAPLNFCMIAF